MKEEDLIGQFMKKSSWQQATISIKSEKQLKREDKEKQKAQKKQEEAEFQQEFEQYIEEETNSVIDWLEGFFNNPLTSIIIITIIVLLA